MFKINDEFGIKTDQLNFILVQKKINKKTQEVYYGALGYFNTIKALGKFYVEHIAKDLPETLDILIWKIEKAKSEIIEACKKIEMERGENA